MLSVVIPTYEDAHCLALTLRSLTRQTLPREAFEVIVARDGAGAGYEVVEPYEKVLDLHVVTLPVRRGRSAARNAGLKLARGRTVTFLDSDSYADPDLLRRHAAFHSGGGPGRVLLGRRYEIDWPHVRHIVRDEPVPVDLLHAAEYGDLRFATGAGDNESAWRHTPWLYAHTNNVSVPADALAAVGGFDEGFGTRWGWEDLELFYRVYQHLGRGVDSFAYDEQAVCYHLPHYRDVITWFGELLENQPMVKRLHPNIDWEFHGFRMPDVINAKVRHFRRLIRDGIDAGAFRVAPVAQWLAPRLADRGARRVLWIGNGTADLPPGPDDLTFDHSAPPSETNYHLVGTDMALPDGIVDVVVNVDFWRCLSWVDLCDFLREAARVAGATLLVHTGADVPHQVVATDAELAYLTAALQPRFAMSVETAGGVTGIWVSPPARGVDDLAVDVAVGG